MITLAINLIVYFLFPILVLVTLFLALLTFAEVCQDQSVIGRTRELIDWLKRCRTDKTERPWWL